MTALAYQQSTPPPATVPLAQYEKVCQDRDRWKAEADRWRARYAWQRDLLAVPATQLSPTDKLAALALYPVVQNQRDRGQTEPETIYLPELAQRVGVSSDTMSKSIRNLESADGLCRKVNRDPDSKRRRVSVTATPRFFEAPSTLEPPAPRNHGGARQVCPECGSDRLMRRTRIVCEDCGAYHDEPPREVNPPETVADDTKSQDAASSKAAKTYPQDAGVRTYCTEEVSTGGRRGAVAAKPEDGDTYPQDAGRSQPDGWAGEPLPTIPESSGIVEAVDQAGGETKPHLAGRSEQPAEPAWLSPIPCNIPQLLISLPHWVVWRAEWTGKKWTKVPYDPKSRHHASSTNPNTWSTLGQALEVMDQEGYSGIGFVFTAGDPFCCIDLDELSDEERRIIAEFATYTERSPSGRGAHCILEGAKAAGSGCRKGNVEIYDRGRFLAITGHLLDGSLPMVRPRQAELDALVTRICPPAEPIAPPRSAGMAASVDDTELIERACSAKNGCTFTSLWRGDVGKYQSAGESGHHLADIALCRHLSYWTDGDPVRIDRLFRRSGLYREKWDRPDGTYGTYGARTIARVLGRQS